MYHYLEVMTYNVPLPGGYDVLCTTAWRLRCIMYHYLEVGVVTVSEGGVHLVHRHRVHARHLVLLLPFHSKANK